MPFPPTGTALDTSKGMQVVRYLLHVQGACGVRHSISARLARLPLLPRPSTPVPSSYPLWPSALAACFGRIAHRNGTYRR